MKQVINKNELPRLAIFGAGGLGIEMLALLQKRAAANLVALVDKTGFVYNQNGLNLFNCLESLIRSRKVSSIEDAIETEDGIKDFLAAHSKQIDGIFYALPNLPNEFIPNVTKEIIQNSDFKGVIVDALKRTTAVKMLHELDPQLKAKGILYLTGCGCTPGLLTAAANLAAQSFTEVEAVKITFGVGIANWQAYRATIREDIAHLPGFNVQKVAAMSEVEIDVELDRRNGLLELVDMEHADDIMLELAGICEASKVKVGGLVDTRNPKKPLSTNVQITGITYQGKRSTHTFTLGDQTTMAANVNGTVLGYLNAGIALQQEYGACGLKTAAELMPRFKPVKVKAPNFAKV
jgi:hypothetical protein